LSLSNYIKELLSVEEYSFSLPELIENSDKSESALKRELSYLVSKGEIIPLRKSFYLIIPPRYSKHRKLPVELYLDKLFRLLGKDYYLGLYSAAKFHGAGHQQIQRDYIITETPYLLNIKKDTIDLRFFTTSNWPKKNIINRKADSGIFKISDPLLTSVDLIHYQTKLGGLNRMMAILEELMEEISESNLKDLLTWYPNKSTLQRFGFLMEEFHADPDLISILYNYLRSIKYYPVLLSPKSNQKPGAVDNKWKVAVNIKMESDI